MIAFSAMVLADLIAVWQGLGMAQAKWVECSESLPGFDVAVLIVGSAWASPMVAKLIADAADGTPSCWSDSDGNGDVVYLDDVTHWMTLPEMPQ